MPNARTFKATVVAAGSRVYVPLPFDPNTVWGAKERHYVTGNINGQTVRALISLDGNDYVLPLGPAWRRDAHIGVDDPVTVTLSPEGPQQGNLAADVTAALAANPQALAFFESLPTFYRNNYMRWVESAKRPETRAARIAEMIALLNAGKRQK
jgi:hypothetical protein